MEHHLVEGPINKDLIAEILQSLGNDCETGGHSVFLGQVRDDIIEGKRVKGIQYSAYEGMVVVEIKKIRKSIIEEYTDVRSIEIYHSVGYVKAGGISLFVVVSAGHRDHATLACRKALELVKSRLPIWKKEIFEDDSYRWKGNNKIKY